MAESSLDSGAACPPSPVQILPGDADSSLSAQNEEQELAGDEVVEKEDAEVEGAACAAEELPQCEGDRSTAGLDVPGSPGQPGAASLAVEGAEAEQLASLAATADTLSCAEKVLDEEREEAAADPKSEDELDDGKVRDVPVWFWCWLFPLSRQALTQESSWSTVCFSVRRVQVLSWSAGQSFLGGHECSEFPDGRIQACSGQSFPPAHSECCPKPAPAKPSPVPWLSRGGGAAPAPSAAVGAGRAGLLLELPPSPAVRAALFLSFSCFSQLAQSWARRVRKCGHRVLSSVRAQSREGQSLGAASGAGGTEPSSAPALGGEVATLQEQGTGLSVTHCPWPGPSPGWAAGHALPARVHLPEQDPSHNTGSDERSRPNLAAFLLILMISQVH